jgi:hypothetical protein
MQLKYYTELEKLKKRLQSVMCGVSHGVFCLTTAEIETRSFQMQPKYYTELEKLKKRLQSVMCGVSRLATCVGAMLTTALTDR